MLQPHFVRSGFAIHDQHTLSCIKALSDFLWSYNWGPHSAIYPYSLVKAKRLNEWFIHDLQYSKYIWTNSAERKWCFNCTLWVAVLQYMSNRHCTTSKFSQIFSAVKTEGLTMQYTLNPWSRWTNWMNDSYIICSLVNISYQSLKNTNMKGWHISKLEK